MSLQDQLTPSLIMRFKEKLRRDGDHRMWTGAVTKGGYGNFRIGRGKYCTPQRVAWELEIGPLDDGDRLYNQCSAGPLCMNPQHWSKAQRVRR